MKTLLLTLLLLLTITAAWAQSPQRISYQSIIRDANNVVVASSAVRVKISLLRGTSTGPAVYVETHGIITNANGLVSLNIGEGRAITGSFAGIDWSNGPYLIQTATDPTGGTDYSIIGTAPLNSVPYALNAANASVATTLAGTLPIASGGTGATTATTARAALGLENVDNTSDANKPVSTAAQTSLSTKVDKVTGKELSTNDYSNVEKTKLAAITGTNTGDQDLSALATTAAVAQKANATDVTTSLATKVDKVTGKELSTNDYSTAEKTKLASITGTNTGDQVNISGNAATATKLQATVTINGIAFDGSANITLPAAAAGIPYTGATQAVDLGVYDLKVNGLTIGRGGGNVDGNTANGSMSLYSNSSGNSNTAYGYASLYSNTTGSNNIANGNQSLYFNTTGSNNTAIGNASLNSNTTGSYNTAVGPSVLYSNTIGSNNTATGYIALYKNTTGTDNTASGMFALYANTTGAYNTATGYGALSANTEGVYNTATGYVALASNTTGLANQASGNYALTDNTTGNSNTASGYSALRANTTGNSNTASGYNALDANTIGTNNTAIGYYANVGSAALTNATAIGAGATVLASNTIQLGDANVAKVITSGTLTAGTITYPNTHGTNGQVLTTTGSGTLTWASAPTYSVGLNPALGGYVFYVTPDGKHGLVAETIDQLGADYFPIASSIGPYGIAQDNLADPAKHSTDGANFSDWRIPSRYEMLLMYNTIGPGATGTNQNIGNFDASRYYLTSTYFDFRYLFYVDFSTGNSSSSERYVIYPFSIIMDKDSVRAVRSF
jgi:trimeric autotransporter adhesin